MAAYVVAYVLPGTGPMLGRNAPVAVVAIGVVYGTVTALGAMALILTYRANRFVNFAYGAMGSLVGVLAIGLYREHGVPFWRRRCRSAWPAACALGAAGRDASCCAASATRPGSCVTVASIGLAQVLGGIELRRLEGPRLRRPHRPRSRCRSTSSSTSA